MMLFSWSPFKIIFVYKFMSINVLSFIKGVVLENSYKKFWS